LWAEQDPDFNANFPIHNKREFKSMRDVRSYAPNKPVQWSRCAQSEFCVMQVYKDGTTPFALLALPMSMGKQK
jgi:hypothetical protein